MSLMRPDMMAGPMLRKAKPESTVSVKALFGASGLAVPAGTGVFGFCAATAADRATSRMMSAHEIRFTTSSLLR